MTSIYNIESETDLIKQLAIRSGFDLVGIADCTQLDAEIDYFNNWVKEKRHASMEWLSNNMDRRANPNMILEGCKSIIAVGANYQPKSEISIDQQSKVNKKEYGKVASYAVNKDYHYTIKRLMKEFCREVTDSIQRDVKLKWYIDTGPVMEKVWAQRAGLGFIGKNTCLINRQKGSWFFLGVILTDLELVPDQAISQNWCGDCRACMDACPTNALIEEGVLDSNKCISYLTIEHREDVDPVLKPDFEGWLFGCDICQDVCPYNIKFATPSQTPVFDRIMPNSLSLDDILDIKSEEKFREKFMSKNPLRRAGLTGLQRTAKILKDSKS